MRWSGNRWWRRLCTAATSLAICTVVILGALGHPVLASYALSALLLCLGIYRLIDRNPQAWLAVRSWPKDTFLLFVLALIVFFLAPYGGLIMPMAG